MDAETPAQRAAARNTSVVHLFKNAISPMSKKIPIRQKRHKTKKFEKKEVCCAVSGRGRQGGVVGVTVGKRIQMRKRMYGYVRVDQEGSAAAVQASFRVEHV